MPMTYSAVFFLQEINKSTCVQALQVQVLPVLVPVLVLPVQVLVLPVQVPVLLVLPGPVPPPLFWQAQLVSFQAQTDSQSMLLRKEWK